MSARDFLNLLKERSLLDDAIIADLRRQLEESGKSVSAETIAKLLVENEHLTRFQATQLVGETTKDKEARRAKRADNKADQVSGIEVTDDDLVAIKGPEADSPTPVKPPHPPAVKSVPVVEQVPVVKQVPVVESVESLDSLESSAGLSTGLGTPGDSVMSPGFQKKKLRDNPWDGPLMLGGGGALALLSFLLYFLWGSLTQGTALEIFNLAMKDYQTVAYTNAMDKFDKFIKRYPRHELISEARVRKSLCTLRMVSDSKRSPEKSLELAQKILPEIKDEAAFPKIREELASILPDIAEGFAIEASDAGTPSDAEALLVKVDEALVLVHNQEYVPPSLLRSRQNQLDRIGEATTLVLRGINQERDLLTAVRHIAESIARGQTREAYETRDKLLAEYPRLENNPRLTEQVEKISQKERSQVTTVAGEILGEGDLPKPAGQHVVLTGTRTTARQPSSGTQIVVKAGGAVYGIESAKGKVLWRRFVGYGTAYHPTPLQTAPGSDVLLVESHSNALLRVRSATGEVVWRLPIGELFNDPQIWRNRILIAAQSGKLMSIDTEDGSASEYAKFNQSLTVAPGIAAQRSYLYQVGDHTNLFVMHQDTLACAEVYYLAHAKDTVVVPPLLAHGHLFVFENIGPDFCHLHVLKTDAQGLKLKQAQSPTRIAGHVVTSPVVDRQRLVVTTDLGAVRIFDVDGTKSPPLSEDIEGKSDADSNPVVGYATVNRADLWVGRIGLSKAQILAAKAQLVSVWSGFAGDTFVAPAMLRNKSVFHVRRPLGAPGFTVGSNDADDPDQQYWQTDVTVPAAITTLDDSGKPMVFSQKGAFFQITDEALQSGYLAPVFADDQSNISYTAGLKFGNVVAMFSPRKAGRLLVFDPSRSTTEMRSFRLNLPDDSASVPIAFQDAMLIPLSNGQIKLLDVATGSDKAAPYHIGTTAGETVRWNRPVVVANGSQIVIAYNKKRVLRLGLQMQGRSRLIKGAETVLKDEVVTPLAELDNFVFAGARYDDADVLLSFSAAKLVPRDVTRLDGRVTWGPVSSGGRILLATSKGELLCFGSDQKQKWSVDLTHGSPTGEPLVVGSDYLIATTGGAIMRLVVENGDLGGVTEIGEPLHGTPLLVDGKVAAVGSGGTFFLVDLP